MDDLRARQRALAREAIVAACAGLVTERRHLDFAMKDVAARAGVSLRTVYNHFPSREDLLDALGAAFGAQMRAMGGEEAADLHARDDLRRAIRVNLGLFEAMGGTSEAFAQMPLADVGRDDARRQRTEQIVGHIAGLMPSVPPSDATAIALLLRHLLSHRSWFWLTREYGLSTPHAADLVGWAVETLIDSAEAGHLPTRTEEP